MRLAGAKTKTKRGTGYRHGDYVVNDEFNNSVYVYNTDSFPPVNNSHNGDPHLPGTVDVTDGQADAATHDRSVDYQYESVSSTDSLLRDLSSDILGQDINDRLYSAILRSLEQTHCARMWFYMID